MYYLVFLALKAAFITCRAFLYCKRQKLTCSLHPQPLLLEALFPGPPYWNTNTEVVQVGRAWYHFWCKHDVIGMGQNFQNRKARCIRCSFNYALSAQYVRYSLLANYIRSKSSTTFVLSAVLSLEVCPRTIKVSLPPLYTWCCSHEKRNTRLSPPAQLQCLHPSTGEAWERG